MISIPISVLNSSNQGPGSTWDLPTRSIWDSACCRHCRHCLSPHGGVRGHSWPDMGLPTVPGLLLPLVRPGSKGGVGWWATGTAGCQEWTLARRGPWPDLKLCQKPRFPYSSARPESKARGTFERQEGKGARTPDSQGSLLGRRGVWNVAAGGGRRWRRFGRERKDVGERSLVLESGWFRTLSLWPVG